LTTVPGTQSNDWNWPLITAEVDAERPCLWGVGPQAGHTMTVIGYRIIGSQKFVIVYNTWGASAAQQLYEYNYREWKGAPNTDTSVGVLEPGGSPGVVQAAVTYPRGGELVFGPTTITWYVWGDQIKSTSVWFSKTGGGSWQFLTGQPTQPGFNSFTTNLLDETSHARISIDCFSESGERLASDGSIKNFYVSGKADLVPVPDAGGFCQIDNGGNLIIKVKNQGSSAAPSSMTFVQFFCINDTTEIHQLATPAIPPGEVAELTVKIPSTCYHPDCNFIITVDSNHNVDEANEDNNSVQGACI